MCLVYWNLASGVDCPAGNNGVRCCNPLAAAADGAAAAAINVNRFVRFDDILRIFYYMKGASILLQ